MTLFQPYRSRPLLASASHRESSRCGRHRTQSPCTIRPSRPVWRNVHHVISETVTCHRRVIRYSRFGSPNGALRSSRNPGA